MSFFSSNIDELIQCVCIQQLGSDMSDELDLYAYFLNSVILYCQIADDMFEHNLNPV